MGRKASFVCVAIFITSYISAEAKAQYRNAPFALDASDPTHKEVNSLLQSFKASRSSKFIEIADLEDGIESIVSSGKYNALVVARLTGSPPTRRNESASQPWIEVIQQGQAWSAGVLGLEALNRGSSLIEVALGRPLYPFRLTFTSFDKTKGNLSGGPVAVWDVSTGHIMLDERVWKQGEGGEEHIARTTSPFAQALIAQLSSLVQSTTPGTGQGVMWAGLLTGVLPKALAVAFGASIPLWFCIACPVVLGLLAPFIFNAGLGAAADALCTHYKLSTIECNDLWYGAFGLAMILSLASAVPIVYICQVPKCGRS